MSICNLVDSIENHSKRHLVTVSFAKWCRAHLVEAHMRLACAQDCHICESDAQKTVVRKAGDSAFEERYRGAVRIQVDHLAEVPFTPQRMHQIDSILRLNYAKK